MKPAIITIMSTAKDTTAITNRAAANTAAIEHFRESEINHADPA